MTREEVNKLIEDIRTKVENSENLTKYHQVVWGQVKLAERENREVLVDDIEEIKFWMD